MRPDLKRFTICLATIATLAAVSAPAMAKIDRPSAPTAAAAAGIQLSAAELAWIKANPRISVHNETDWPPFNFAAEGKPQGFSIDFMNLVAGNVGLQVDYITGPSWGEFLEMMKNGSLDVMLNIVNTQERRKYLKFTRPYADNPNTILSRKDAPYDSLEQLFGKTISVPKGFFYEEILSREFPKIKLHLVKGTLEAMKAVSFGKADAALGELAVFNHLLGKHLMTGLAVSGEVKMGNPEYALLNMASRKDTPLLASILDKGIRSITIEQVRSIQRKWLGESRVTKGRSKAIQLTSAEKAWLAAHRNIRLGIDPAYPPFEFRSADGNLSGISSDYLALVNERLGTEIKVVPGLTWSEVISAAEAGSIDVLSAALRSPRREEFLLFTKPHLEFPTVILTRDDHPFVANLDDLAGRKIALVEDFAVTDIIVKDYPKVVPHMVEGPLEALQAVSVGEAQAVVINLAVATNIIRRNNLTNIKVAAPAGLDIKGLSFAVRKDWPELATILEKALASITPEEETAIRNKWIAVRYEHVADTWALVKVALQVGGIAVVILVVIVVWNRRLRHEIIRHEATQKELTEQKALLDAVFENMDQGVVMYNSDLIVTAFNEQARRRMRFPEDVLFVGASFKDMDEYARGRGDPGTGEDRMQAKERWDDLRKGRSHALEFVHSDGAVIETRRRSVPDGGFVVTHTDVTESRRAEEELKAAKEEAEAVAQAKSDFVAVVSHEVRTPMNGVLGMARLMLETPLNGEQAEYARTIVESGEGLLTILNDLLDISKLEAGKLEIEAFAFAPGRLLTDTGNIMRARAIEKGLKFDIRVGSDVPPAVIGDGNRLRQIIFNLLSNATKFTDRGEIALSVTSRAIEANLVELAIKVSDTGRGIDPKTAEELFAPYVQANVDVARRFGGTGLGLSISRQLAGLLGGSLTLESELGKGSTFTLFIPFEVAESLPIATNMDAHWKENGAGRGLRILLVEDNRINRTVAERMIDKLGHKVKTAENGQIALDMLETEDPFDVILMDRHMPVMDGIEATRHIRSFEGVEGTIPIIAVTAAVTEREVKACLEAGMNDVVTKPIDPRLLEDALRRVAAPGQDDQGWEANLGAIPQADEPPVLDRGVIDALNTEYGGDTAAELVAMFRDLAPAALAGFQAAVEADDLDQMMHHSHDLKSSAANVGLMRLSRLCLEIEKASDSGQGELAREMGQQLPAAIDQAIRALDTRGKGAADDLEPAEAQSLFLARMGHDLRNVMNTVTGYITMLQTGAQAECTPEEVEEYADEIRAGGDQMLGLSESMLDLIKLQGNSYRNVPEAMDAQEIVRHSAESAKETAAERGIRIKITAPGKPVVVHSDPLAFRRMLDNLIANAVQASPTTGAVHIRVDRKGDEMVLRVNDAGPGLTEDIGRRLHEPFGGLWQDDNGATLPNLRYAVAAQLAALQGGHLHLDNQAEGGAVATVTLS